MAEQGRLRVRGKDGSRLIGARVELTAGGRKQYRWIHSDQSYKSGSALEAHFGLGKHDRAAVRVTLLSGAVHTFKNVKADRVVELDLSTVKTGKAKP